MQKYVLLTKIYLYQSHFQWEKCKVVKNMHWIDIVSTLCQTIVFVDNFLSNSICKQGKSTEKICNFYLKLNVCVSRALKLQDFVSWQSEAHFLACVVSAAFKHHTLGRYMIVMAQAIARAEGFSAQLGSWPFPFSLKISFQLKNQKKAFFVT